MQKQKNNEKNQTLILGWLDPRDESVINAGVGFYNADYDEYNLRIDEEPKEKTYRLRPFGYENNRVLYRMELVIKDKNGKFIRRQKVGDGFSDQETSGNIFINYGSKFKTLIVYLKEDL